MRREGAGGGRRAARRRAGRVRLAGLALAAAVAAGCAAPTQTVWLDLGPDRPALFVDGERWPDTPDRLELRADRDHTLFFRQPGHRPQWVVLESVEGEAGPELRPGTLRIRLLPLAEGGRAVEVELDEGPGSGDAPAP